MRSRNEITQQIIKLWKTLLESELELSDESNFFKYGGTSILAVELVKAIQAEYGVKISLLTLVKKPTIGALVAYIQEEQVRITDGCI